MTYPLYNVTGLSGSGKSTAAVLVRDLLGRGYCVYDMDYILVNGDYMTACNQWLRVAYLNALSGSTTVLFGNNPLPYDFSRCDHYQHFGPIHTLLLHCSPEVRADRLRKRGSLWTEANLRSTFRYAMIQYYKAKHNPNIPIIDTSVTPKAVVAERIAAWVRSARMK